MTVQRSLAGVLVLCALGACSGRTSSSSPPSASARTPDQAQPEPALLASEKPATGDDALLAQEGTFSPLCARPVAECERFLEVDGLLRKGHVELAATKLEEWNGSKQEESFPYAGIIALLLRGRVLLEGGSLSYASGGEEARAALVLFDEARTALHDAPSEGVASLAAQLTLQRCRALLALGKGDTALGHLRQLAHRFEREAEVQAALGIAYLSVGRLNESLGPLRKAARLDPNEPERHVVLGTAQMLADQPGEAEASFRKALALKPTDPKVHGDLGALLLLVGRIDEGREHLRRATQLAPTQATYLSNLAYAELLSDNPQACQQLSRKATELNPRLASAWLNLGLCLVQMRQLSAARDAFLRARELDPSDPRAENNLRDLDELEESEE